MPERLMRRGATYYLRARYPSDLCHLFKSAERWKSLGTRDFKEAKRRLAIEIVRFNAEMSELRSRRDAPVKADLSPAEIDAIAASYFRDLMVEDEEHRIEGLSDHDFRVVAESIDVSSNGARADVARGNLELWQDEFDDWLETQGHKLDPQSNSYRTVLNRMLREFVRFLDASEKRQQGDPVDTPPPPAVEERGPTLRELIDAYLADPSRNRNRKTVTTYRIIFDALSEIVGDDKPARDVTRADCERIRDVLLKLPSNARKKYPGVPLETAVQLGARDGAPVLNPGTVNAYLNNLASLFNWGVETWRVERNPARGLSVHDPVSDRDRRKPFPLEALPAIFNAPLYTGCLDDGAGYAKPGPNHPRQGRFWVPLLSVFHGVRLGEACQLHVADVQSIDGTWVMLLSDEQGEDTDDADRKRVKTEAGRRYVPLHAELERIGFLDFVAERRASGATRLFPEIKRAADGYFSSFSKWFGRFVEKAGVKEKRVSFHSFRHNYRDALRRAEVPRDAVIALGGWTGQGTDDDYGSRMGPRDLAKYVARVEFPGLSLSHLYLGADARSSRGSGA